MTELGPSTRTRALRIALAVLAGALGTVLVAAGLWMVFRPDPPAAPTPSAYTPAEETQEPTLPVPPSSIATGSTGATASPDATTSTSGSPDSEATVERAAKVAFRLGNTLYVANEDGSAARPVSPAYPAYALSPDGKRIAVIPGPGEDPPPGSPSGKGSVFVLEVGGRWSRGGSGAQPMPLSWSADSKWLAFSSQSSGRWVARRLEADGGGQRTLGTPSARPAVSLDGKRIASLVTGKPALGSQLQVSSAKGGGLTPVSHGNAALAYAWAPDGSLYFTRASAAPSTWEIWRVDPSGASALFASVPLKAPAFALDDLAVSPNGKALVLATIGDDQYSRLHVLDLNTKTVTAISTRMDAYPYGWTADGQKILYFEGNSYQGESSSLASIRPDGSGRRLLVTGAQQ